MLNASKTWQMTEDANRQIANQDAHMLRLVTGFSKNESLQNFNLEPLRVRLRKTRLRWYGHLERMNDNQWPKMARDVGILGRRSAGRPKMTWRQTVENDLKATRLRKEDAQNKHVWETKIKALDV